MLRIASASLFLAGAAVAQSGKPVMPGDYVIIYGKIEGCPEFPGILAQHKAARHALLEVPKLRPVHPLRKTPGEIYKELAIQIEELRDKGVPSSLRVEVLRSEQQYLMIRERILQSIRFLAFDYCSIPKRDRPDHRPYDERRYQIDWDRIAGPPNNALQRMLDRSLLLAPG